MKRGGNLLERRSRCSRSSELYEAAMQHVRAWTAALRAAQTPEEVSHAQVNVDRWQRIADFNDAAADAADVEHQKRRC